MRSSKCSLIGAVLMALVAGAPAQVSAPAAASAPAAKADVAHVQAKIVEEMLQADTKAALEKVRPPAPPPVPKPANLKVVEPELEVNVDGLRGYGDKKVATLSANGVVQDVKVGDTFAGFSVVRVGDGCVGLSKPAKAAVAAQVAKVQPSRRRGATTARASQADAGASPVRTVCYQDRPGVVLASTSTAAPSDDEERRMHEQAMRQLRNRGTPLGTPLPTVPVSILPPAAAPTARPAPGLGGDGQARQNGRL